MVTPIPDQQKPQSSPPKSRKRDPWATYPCAECAALGADPAEGLIEIDSPALLHRCLRRGIDDAITMADQSHFDHHDTHFRVRKPYAAEVRELRLLEFNVPASGQGLSVEVWLLVNGTHFRHYIRRGQIVWRRSAWLPKVAATTGTVGAAR